MEGIMLLLGFAFLIGAILVFIGLVIVLFAAVNKERSQRGLKMLLWGGLMMLGSFTLCSTMWR